MSDIPRQPALEEEVELAPEDAETEIVEDTEAEADEAGGDADDGDGQEEGAEAEGDVDEPAPRRGGGSATVRAQRRRAQEAEARAVAAEQRIAALENQQRQPAYDPQAAARAEQEFYASLQYMPEEQRLQAVVQRERQNIGQYIQGIEFRSNDRLDKQAYDATARTSKVHQQYRPQVEQMLAAERQQGRNPDREVILKYLVGNDVLERGARAAPAQRAAGARRVAGQQTAPTGARSNTQPAARRPQPGSLEADRALVNAAIARGESVL